MAHLPEPPDEIEHSVATFDPVVRQPKVLAAMPEPPSYPLQAIVRVVLVALAIGGALGAVGVGIVFAMQRHRASRTTQHAGAPAASADAGASSVVLESAHAEAGPTPPRALVTGAAANYGVEFGRLGRNQTLPRVLQRMGLTGPLASDVVRSLRPLVNMRTLQPTDMVLVMRERDGTRAIRRVEYRRSDTQVWAVTLGTDQACSSERVEVVKTTERFVTGFVVGNSLDDTLRSAELQGEIVPRLQEAFAALDLGTRLSRGDAVRIVGEQERLNGVFFRYVRMEAVDYRGVMGHRRGYYVRVGASGGEWFDAQGDAPERGPLHSPVPDPRISSGFNLRRMHPVLHRIMPHLGTDFGAASGTPVYAAADGVVLSVGRGGPTGNLVRVSHAALGIETGYAHLSRFAPGIHAGQHVRVRDLVGYVGSTGRSTGPHLHFSCKRGGTFFDCQTIYRGRRVVPATARGDFDAQMQRNNSELDAVRLDGQLGTVPVPGATPTPTVPTAPVAAPASAPEAPATEETGEPEDEW